jgi:hypothetical protein
MPSETVLPLLCGGITWPEPSNMLPKSTLCLMQCCALQGGATRPTPYNQKLGARLPNRGAVLKILRTTQDGLTGGLVNVSRQKHAPQILTVSSHTVRSSRLSHHCSGSSVVSGPHRQL